MAEVFTFQPPTQRVGWRRDEVPTSLQSACPGASNRIIEGRAGQCVACNRTK